jgi:ATP-dependent Lon protease
MTGEVSLKGKIGAVGGVPQKVIAAYKRGRKLVILPKANASDVEDVPKEVREKVEIRLVENVREVIEIALK